MKQFQFWGELVNRKILIVLIHISFNEHLDLNYFSLIFVHLYLKFYVFIREWQGRFIELFVSLSPNNALFNLLKLFDLVP